MALRKSIVRYDKIFVAVLGTLFGIIGLVAVYYAATSSTESRSKAAESQTIFKQWEFNGASADGWTKAKTSGGFLRFPATSLNTPSTENNTVNASLPSGAKTITFSLGVIQPGSTGTPRCPPNVACDIETQTSVKPFSAKLIYTPMEKSIHTRPLIFTGVLNGQMKTYSLVLPNSEAFTISDLQLIFTEGTKPGDKVSLDWIRIGGQGVTPTSGGGFMRLTPQPMTTVNISPQTIPVTTGRALY